ncbi:putative bifunctional diguanylate cyclase/phosphodiesterase [Shewanella waksmanii]|uniref:putative bifunctional diguanylate cyclase/phosphodiesterase n=1 Tax=Shewanella waksmanii TaxID=213783 RepID=UPI003736C0D1
MTAYFAERESQLRLLLERHQTATQQQLMRMKYVAAEAIAERDYARIEDEISVAATDLSTTVYTLLDQDGSIRFSNYVVWKTSLASLVIDGYSAQKHAASVASNQADLFFNPSRQSLQAYYPLQLEHGALDVTSPNIIYYEYDLAPVLSAMDKQLLSSGVRVLLLAVLGLLLFGIVVYLLLLRPLGKLANHPFFTNYNGDTLSVRSPFSEITKLQQQINHVSQRYQANQIELKDSQQRWLFAVEVSQYGIWDWNLQKNQVYYSDRWKDMIGYAPDELTGCFDTWESKIHPDDKADVLQALNSYLSGHADSFENVHRLKHKQGHYIWVLDRGMIVDWDKEGNPLRMIGTHSDVSEDVRNQKTVSHQTSHDQLTDLANRRSLLDELYEIKQSQCLDSAAVFVVDLDNFKGINDTLGHHAGDRLLIQIAARLSSYFSNNALIARLAADEFVILVKHLPAEIGDANRRAAALASQIRQLIARSFYINNNTLNVSASVGIATIGYQEKVEPEQILRRADLAMSQAKENGKDACVLYTPDMEAKAKQHQLIRNELGHAIARNQLSLVFQPLVDARGRLRSVEALLRWYHPEKGHISPGIFIPIVEGSELIVELGQWVIESVCQLINNIEAMGLIAPLFSVNVSARQFNQPEFANTLLATLAKQDVRPQMIELELTEYALLSNLQQVKETMSILRNAGVSIAVDDFGTGYSSLSYIQSLPLNRLKLDASFIRHINDTEGSGAIVKSVIDMAHSLNLEFVAEGVETEQQAQWLKSFGCDTYQGYYFHRPMPELALIELLELNRTAAVSVTH